MGEARLRPPKEEFLVPRYIIIDKDGDFNSVQTAANGPAALRKAVENGDIYVPNEGESTYSPYEVVQFGESAGKYKVAKVVTEKIEVKVAVQP